MINEAHLGHVHLVDIIVLNVQASSNVVALDHRSALMLIVEASTAPPRTPPQRLGPIPTQMAEARAQAAQEDRGCRPVLHLDLHRSPPGLVVGADFPLRHLQFLQTTRGAEPLPVPVGDLSLLLGGGGVREGALAPVEGEDLGVFGPGETGAEAAEREERRLQEVGAFGGDVFVGAVCAFLAHEVLLGAVLVGVLAGVAEPAVGGELLAAVFRRGVEERHDGVGGGGRDGVGDGIGVGDGEGGGGGGGGGGV